MNVNLRSIFHNRGGKAAPGAGGLDILAEIIFQKWN